jgi:DNA-binding transcriptional ArsR family regulator
MKGTNITLLDAKAKILKALAHQTRIYMVEELMNGEKCVCEFVEAVGSDFSTISKHLSLLKDAGIVKVDKRGQKVFYSLKTPCVTNFLDCIETIIKNNLKEQTSMFSSGD